jgi:alkylation response protein AidB-like acyl-CoA dehydrogenase
VPISTHPELSDSQAALQAATKNFAQNHLAPGASERDKTCELPIELFREAARVGLVGVNLPERFGGGGLGLTEAALVLEQLAGVDGSFALTVGASAGLTGGHILRAATETQAARWIPPLTRGELGAWALTEPGAGSDAAALVCKAEKTGGSYLINGLKIFVSQGKLFSVMILMARTGEGRGGISALIIETDDAGRESFLIEGKLGMRSMDTARVVLKNCEVPANRLLGAEGDGFSQAMETLVEGRIGAGAVCLGLGQGALDAATEYARGREAFGRSISDFAGVRGQLADCAISLSAARELVYRAARVADSHNDAGPAANMAKLFASEAALKVCDRSIQVHGGQGYIDTSPVNRFWRDARLMTVGEGSSEIIRGVISRSVFEG